MRTATDTVVLPITEPLLTRIAAALRDSLTPTDLRPFLYICIGLIIHRNPSLVQQNLQILKFLFDSAVLEPQSIKISIIECLSMVFPAVLNPPRDVGSFLIFLMQNIVEEAPDVAMKFVPAFPFSSIEARAIALHILGETGLSSDLRQNAKYALDPYYFKLGSLTGRTPLPPDFYAFPAFDEAVTGFVEFTSDHRAETLRFLRLVWLHEALGDTFKFDDENWRDRLEAAVEVDDATRSKIKAFLNAKMVDHDPTFEKYFTYLRQVLSTENEDELVLSANMVLELVSLGGKDLSAALVSDMNAIRELVFSRNELLRVKSAELLGFVCGENSSSVESMIVSILRFAEGSVERQHGAIIAVGAIIGRISIKGTLGAVSSDVLNKFVTNLSQLIESPNTNTLLLEAGLQALSSLCIFGAGNLLQTSHREAIIGRLQTLSKSSQRGSLQDRAVLALGYLSFSFTIPDDEPLFSKILDALYAVHEQKQVELAFSAGEALSCVAARWSSKAMAKFRDAQTDLKQSPPEGLLDRVLNTILEYVRSPKHPLRKVLYHLTLLI